MAGHHQNSSRDLEDRLRQMMISNTSSPSSGLFDPDTIGSGQPAVRLPPSNSYVPTVRLPPSNQYAQPTSANSPVQPPHLRHQQQPQKNGQATDRTTHNSGAYMNGHSPIQRPGPQYNGRQQQMQRPYNQHPPPQNYRPQGGFNAPPNGHFGPPNPHQQRARNHQQMQIDPNAFQRDGYDRQPMGRGQGSQQLFNPHEQRATTPSSSRGQQHQKQMQYLESLATAEIAKANMTPAEYEEKESFAATLRTTLQQVCAEHRDRFPPTSLEPFGSFKSGFASAGSDMDLVIVVQDSSSLASACFSLLEDDLPRVLEKRLLEVGLGARLLTRTRVPIIKVCERPEGEFLQKLRVERERWNGLPEEEKYPHLFPEKVDEAAAEGTYQSVGVSNASPIPAPDGTPALPTKTGLINNGSAPSPTDPPPPTNGGQANPDTPKPRRKDDAWTRERKAGPLDFPKSGVGIQSDINFFNPLGLHNTHLLRCYSLCDPRVRPMILFVKAWAKKRKINSSYSGTLSSYGYVLMVLHYLVHVANPAVLPNLQAERTPTGETLGEGEVVDGWVVRFWRDESAITTAAEQGLLTQNREPLGSLLAGFFHYFSSLANYGGGGFGGRGASFHWTQQALSLRTTAGGLLTKEAKGWVKAVTEESEGKRVQHRYLFCIEDPFESGHNVARTVTHKGIVAIRDEFRRAHRVLVQVGLGVDVRGGVVGAEGALCDELVEEGEGEGAIAGEKISDSSHGQGASRQRGGVERGGTTVGHAPHQRQSSGTTQKAHINPSDTSAFPSLATAPKTSPVPKANPATKKAPRKRVEQGKSAQKTDQGKFSYNGDASNEPGGAGTFSEISGERARAIVEEAKRRRHEAAAESTATLAAERVLEGVD